MKKQTNHNDTLVPMRELEKQTDMTRPTINFYIKEGILPAPQKSAKNMAYYDITFIKKLKMIETLKKENYSLSQIKKLINSDSGSLNDFCIQILESVNKLLPYGIEELPISKDQILELGLNNEIINELVSLKVLESDKLKPTFFKSYSLTICKFIKYFLDLGIPLNQAAEIIYKLKELAALEKNIFVEYIRCSMIEKKLSQEDQKNEVEACIQNINALLPILHLQFIKQPTENILDSEK